MQSILNDKEENPGSAANDSKKNDKDDSRQILDKPIRLLSVTPSIINLNRRYQLTSANYVSELHKALVKECYENLLDFKMLNASLDFESLTNVSNRTYKAIKVND